MMINQYKHYKSILFIENTLWKPSMSRNLFYRRSLLCFGTYHPLEQIFQLLKSVSFL